MLKQLSFLITAAFIILALQGSFADNDPSSQSAPETSISDIKIPINCPQNVFANALNATAGNVTEDDNEYVIEAWIYSVFQNPENIRKFLACPEISNLKDTDIFSVPPIEFNFGTAENPDGELDDARTIIINYSSTKKILNGRLLIAHKPKNPGKESESVSLDGDVIWINTEPAWYGVLVVDAGAMDNYVGKGKNNTISVKYMAENRDNFFPKNAWLGPTANQIPLCVSGSAFANDSDIINIAAHKTTGEKPKWFSGNDYYVAGDINLQWVTWAEVAGDIAITVATIGTGTAVSVAAKSLRTGKTIKNITREIKVLKNLESVKNYRRAVVQLARAENIAKDFDKIKDITNAVLKVDDIKDLTRGFEKSTDLMKNAQKWKDAEKKAANIKGKLVTARQDVNKYRNAFKDELVKLRADKLDEVKKLKDKAAVLENTDDVKKYKTAMDNLGDVRKLAGELKAWKIPQRGNIIARVIKTVGAEMRTNKILKTAGRGTAKASSMSGRIRDGLFNATLKTASAGGRAYAATGAAYGLIRFVGEMYDWTDTETAEFTSNIQFKPFGLLSADDLAGQGNVVNRGMWLMWAGDSIAPADDDAAYLQTMDFAQKFYEDTAKTQDELANSRASNQLCDIDIFVVRPIIRNPGTDDEIYYLIMNEVPWQIRK